MWSAPWRKQIVSSGCHGDRKAANFSSAVCSPMGEADKKRRIRFYAVVFGLPLAQQNRLYILQKKIMRYYHCKSYSYS
jgi:hypothetical protein